MSEILQNTGVTLWSIRDDYDELQTSVFEALTGTGGKSNIRLIDEAIGNINSKLNGYYFEYSDDRLYICKKSENENIKRYPVTLNDNNGHIASKVDGSTITIDENGIVRGLPVDDALSSISTNPIQNKVVKAKVDEIEKNVSKNTEDIKKNVTNISNNTQKITSLETAVSSEKTRAESVENQLKTDLENGKKVWDDKYTKSEVDNKFSTLETNIDWKEAVSTFDDIATTYPTPDDGWTVNVKDTDYTYRYNGTKWVAISANAIPKATDKVDGLMTKEYAKKLDGLTKYTPDGTTITADEDGTLHGADTIQVDGITITRDDATKVIALAKTLQDKIALVDNKIDKANVANNLTTTEADFVLDARQGKALQDQLISLNGSLNGKKVPTIGIENIFTGNPFCIVNSSDVISVQTDWDIDNGGYRVKNIRYPVGTTINLTVSLSLPANSIVIVDVNTLNGENIDIQGSLIRSNFTSSPENWNLSIRFTGRTNQVSTDIRYMPLVIHLG